MPEWPVAGRRVAPAMRGSDEFRRAGSSVLGERTGHLMKISHIASRQEWLAARLDLTPLGRQRYINEWPWHDTYGASDGHAHHH